MLSKKLFILLFVTLVWGFIDAQAKSTIPDYYPLSFVAKLSPTNLDSQDLKKELFKVLSLYHIKTDSRDLLSESCDKNQKCYRQLGRFSYREAREKLFGHLHLHDSSHGPSLRDAYCQKDFYAEDGVGENQVPNHLLVNCEHTWPQSKFSRKFSKNMQKVDLHHLFPVDSHSNSTRSNHVFSEVDGKDVSEYCSSSQIGQSKMSQRTRAFEPPDEHKGNVARAMFYFSVRYNLKIDEVQEYYLKKWHKQDPVDDFEIWRNEQIYQYQQNRNPFIDLPELVQMIDNF